MLPRSVQEAADRAEAAQKALLNPAVEAAQEQSEAKAEPEKVDVLAEQSAETTVVEKPAEEDAYYWRNRFNILQGKYNAEVPALNAKVRDLNQEIERLKSATQSSGNAVEDAKAAVADMTEAELDDYGPELIAMIERIAQRTMQTKQANPQPQRDDELRDKVDQLVQDRQHDTQARFYADLQRLIPDLQAVNSDPQFLAYLSEQEGYTGQTRQHFLTQAEQRKDAVTVAAIFNEFKKRAGSKREIPQSKVAPEHSRSSVPIVTEEKFWSGAEISQFYADVAKGRYSKEERDRLEQSIFEAQAQGRIR